MWEKRVIHNGLNAYRLVRGQTEEEVETKAHLQLAQWEDRWQKRVKLEQAREARSFHQLAAGVRIRNDQAAKTVALERTRDLEYQREVLANLLKTVCSTNTTLDWEALKDRSTFPVPPPPGPKFEPVPPPPTFANADYVPEVVTAEFNFLDRLIPALRRKKLAAAADLTAQFEIEARKRSDSDAAERQKKTEQALKVADAIRQANAKLRKRYDLDLEVWSQARGDFQEKQMAAHFEVNRSRERYLAKDESAVTAYVYDVLGRSQYPDNFPRQLFLQFNAETRTLVLDFELPSPSVLPSVKEVRYVAARSEFQETPASDAWLKKTFDEVLYQVCLRTIYEIFRSDGIDAIRSLVFNGWVSSIARATGCEVHACVMSIEVAKDEFLAINLSQVDPKACFKSLKGIAASRLAELTPIKPLILINREDKRFVEGYDVIAAVDDRTNLAAMDWLDFENLIRELFEKEFSKGGGEVKITQASRDGGVDAIAFDPDPIRGGKLVIQAKRYTNTVGVSAVRDLYGTVHNEGANKGILVTTSDFGPDAYAFAKDKPLTLLSGGELLHLLARHGHSAKIDLADARRIASEMGK